LSATLALACPRAGVPSIEAAFAAELGTAAGGEDAVALTSDFSLTCRTICCSRGSVPMGASVEGRVPISILP